MKITLSKSKKATIFSMVLPLFLMGEVHANAQDVHDIIDICTSSQRVVKDYALMGMKIEYHNPKKDLDAMVKHMEQEMEVMEKHGISKALHAEELALHKEWKSIEAELQKKPSKAGALTLHHHVNAFAHHCEVMAEHLSKDTHTSAMHDEVLLGRINLDVQDLAASYIMHAWGAEEDTEYYKEVEELLADYQKAYDELEGADEKEVSAEVKAHLKVTGKHFMAFEFMAESRSGRYVPLLIAKKADKIYTEIKKILKEEESEVEK